MSQCFRATTRRQLLFTTKSLINPGTHFIDLGKLSRPWTIRFETKTPELKSSALTTRPLFHKIDNVNNSLFRLVIWVDFAGTVILLSTDGEFFIRFTGVYSRWTDIWIKLKDSWWEVPRGRRIAASYLKFQTTRFYLLLVLYNLWSYQKLLRRQKNKSPNGCYKKTKHTKCSEKRLFLTPWYTYVSEGKKCSFFGKFGVLFLITSVSRFTTLSCYRRLHQMSSAAVARSCSTKKLF